MPIPLGILAVAGAGAAGAAGSYELIESVILSSTSSNVTFSNIPQTYKHLQIRAVTRNNVNYYLDLRLNGVTSGYAYHKLWGQSNAVYSGAVTSASSIQFAGYPSNENGDSTNFFGAAIIDILDYASTSKNKTVRGLNGAICADTRLALSSGFYASTSAVTSLSFVINTYSIGSRFSLYGIKG